MGRPRKVVVEADPALKGWEKAEETISEILQERCGITGCRARYHVDEAKVILKVLLNEGLLKERE